jgi:pimeloyl-ACP methyl ester carboxylesterase
LIKKETGYFKSFDGTKLYYEVRGSGQPIVMCYGIGCLINHWRPQIKQFSEKFQTIAFDYRAHHKSEIPSDRTQVTIDALARDTLALMDHLGVPSASVWGHSFGAQVILRAYDIRPESFNSLVFVNGFARDPIASMFGNASASKIFKFVKSGFDLAPETITYIWKMILKNPVSVHASALLGGFNISLTQLRDIEIYLRGVASIDLQSFLTLFENMMTYDARPVFDRITCPTLIIGGKKDSVTPLQYQEEMHLKIKTSSILIVPYGSHCTQLDMPDFINLRLEKFLQQVGYGATIAAP